MACGIDGKFRKCNTLFTKHGDIQSMAEAPQTLFSVVRCKTDLLQKGLEKCERICTDVLFFDDREFPMVVPKKCLRWEKWEREKGPSQPLPPIPKGSSFFSRWFGWEATKEN